MNLKMSIAIICFLLGIVMMLFHFMSSSNHLPKADSVNLALRQAAHRMYSLKGDTTSQIPPVEQISATRFSLRLDEKVAYDTLPFLLDQAFVSFNISANYEVSIRNCQTDLIVLGYNYYSFKNEDVTCLSREQVESCNTIGLTFMDNEVKAYTQLIGSIFFLLTGVVILLLKNKTLAEPDIITEAVNAVEIEPIHLGNSYFIPENFSIKVNDELKTLTFRETKLLAYFFNSPKEVLHREDIKSHVWGDEGIIVGRSVDVFVSRLRKVLKEDEHLTIKNVHGIGYRLDVQNNNK